MLSLPRFSAVALLAVLALPVSAIEPGSATGSITVNGKKTALKYAVAVRVPSSLDKKKSQTKLLISDVQVPPAALADTFAMMKIKDLSGVEVGIEDDGQITTGMIYSPLLTKMGGSFSAVGAHELERKDSAADTIAGRLHMSKPDDFFDYTYQYDATFAAKITDGKAAVAAASKTPGKALPADGGEPGAAYRNYLAAMKAGDAKKVKSLVAKDRAKQMESPEFKEMFAMIREMMPKDIKVTGGTIDGGKAYLVLTAKQPDDGTKTSGKCDMVLEDGVWRVEKESWTTQ